MQILILGAMLLQIASDTAQQVIDTVVNTGLAIHNATGGGQLINGIDNGFTASVLSVLIGAIWRAIEKRKVEKRIRKKVKEEFKIQD